MPLDNSDFSVQVVQSAHDLLAALNLRREVFSVEQGYSMDLEIDDTDFAAQTIHLIGKIKDEVVAVGRITPPELQIAADLIGLKLPVHVEEGKYLRPGSMLEVSQCVCSVHLGRLAVPKYLRGRGIGALLVRQSCQKLGQMLRLQSPVLVELSAQEYAIEFYERQGFSLVPGRSGYMDGHIRHWDMLRIMDFSRK